MGGCGGKEKNTIIIQWTNLYYKKRNTFLGFGNHHCEKLQKHFVFVLLVLCCCCCALKQPCMRIHLFFTQTLVQILQLRE